MQPLRRKNQFFYHNTTPLSDGEIEPKDEETLILEDGWQERLLDVLSFDGGVFGDEEDDDMDSTQSNVKDPQPSTLDISSAFPRTKEDRIPLPTKPESAPVPAVHRIDLPVSLEDFGEGDRVFIAEDGIVIFGQVIEADDEEVVFYFETQTEIIVSRRDPANMRRLLAEIKKLPEVSMIEIGTLLSRKVTDKYGLPTTLYAEVIHYDATEITLKYQENKNTKEALADKTFAYDENIQALEIFLKDWEIEE